MCLTILPYINFNTKQQCMRYTYQGSKYNMLPYSFQTGSSQNPDYVEGKIQNHYGNKKVKLKCSV